MCRQQCSLLAKWLIGVAGVGVVEWVISLHRTNSKRLPGCSRCVVLFECFFLIFSPMDAACDKSDEEISD